MGDRPVTYKSGLFLSASVFCKSQQLPQRTLLYLVVTLVRDLMGGFITLTVRPAIYYLPLTNLHQTAIGLYGVVQTHLPTIRKETAPLRGSLYSPMCTKGCTETLGDQLKDQITKSPPRSAQLENKDCSASVATVVTCDVAVGVVLRVLQDYQNKIFFYVGSRYFVNFLSVFVATVVACLQLQQITYRRK